MDNRDTPVPEEWEPTNEAPQHLETLFTMLQSKSLKIFPIQIGESRRQRFEVQDHEDASKFAVFYTVPNEDGLRVTVSDSFVARIQNILQESGKFLMEDIEHVVLGAQQTFRIDVL